MSEQQASPDTPEAILQYVEDLDQKLREMQHALLEERDRGSRARKKIRQLLHKLGERDKTISQLQSALNAIQAATAFPMASKVTGRSSSPVMLEQSSFGSRDLFSKREPAERSQKLSKQPSTGSLAKLDKNRQSVQAQPVEKQVSPGLTSRDLAIRERTEIITQLEGHLTQMRINLAEGEREVNELEERKRAKEAEWSRSPVGQRTESAQMHWHAIGVIGQQVTEKRRFTADLAHKAQELELQVLQQRQIIDKLTGQSNDGAAEPVQEEANQFVSDEEVSLEDAEEDVPVFDPEALQTFLAAAGPGAEIVALYPSLLQAFKAMPPSLTGISLEGCSSEERAHGISLLIAWAAISARELHVSDLPIQDADAEAWESTLETCGAQLETWEVSRCHASEAIWQRMFAGAITQPLRRLNLGYNGLGPNVVRSLLDSAVAWKSSLEYLGLEMNGLGDAGCRLITKVLGDGLLTNLQTLELGWNELSSESAELFTALLNPTVAAVSPHGEGGLDNSALSVQDSGVPWLCKLGLSGNSLGSAGAKTLALGALSQPARSLELDLAMNHIGSEPLRAIAEWFENAAATLPKDAAGTSVALSISLEWNNIEDRLLVRRLADAVAAAKVQHVGRTGQSTLPLVKLGNNEIADLDPHAIYQASEGLVVC